MIKTKNGIVEISGTICEVKADLAVIVCSFYKNALLSVMAEDEAKRFVLNTVTDALEMADKSEAETDDCNELTDLLSKFMKELGDFIEEMKGQGEK